MKNAFSNNTIFICICSIFIAVTISYFYSRGNLSPRQLGISLLVFVCCFFGLIAYRIHRKYDSQPSTSTNFVASPSALRTIRVAIIVLPVILLVGWWLTMGEPLFPRLLGALVNLFFTGWLASLLLRAKNGVRKQH